MSKQGRYGKYGEQKRIARLRDAGTQQQDSHQKADPRISKNLRHHGKGSAKPKIVIQKADRSDVGFIRSLSETVFSPYGPYGNLLPEWFLTGLVVALKAVMRKTPRGFFMLGIMDKGPLRIRRAELVAVAVEPEFQGMGVGDRLMTAGLKMAEERSIEQVILHTGVDNLAAQALFEKHGFVLSGRKEGFYPNGQNALKMTRAMATG
ncbi:MAG: N-acetyltransferase [Deltaproteobacteria bacterium]|nr:N-acetyltransferase [Deltaproteobacteria bacterium]